MSVRADIAAVVLAGGSSERMGEPKAALRLGSQAFVERIVRGVAAAGLAPILIVVGKHAAETRAVIPEGLDVELLTNPAPERGQLSSLKIALQRLGSSGSSLRGALVSLVDHPAVRPETVATLCREARDATDTAIVLPRHAGRRGHPVYFSSAVFAELLATPDELGARAVVQRDPARVLEVQVDDPGILRDIDTPQDLERLRSG